MAEIWNTKLDGLRIPAWDSNVLLWVWETQELSFTIATRSLASADGKAISPVLVG